MKKSLIILTITILSLNLFAKDVVLDKSTVKVELGDITPLANGAIVETLNIIQNESTPEKVELHISYKKPESYCTQEEDYIVTPDCGDEGGFMSGSECDQYIATRCITYEFSTDPDDLINARSSYLVKFKNKKKQNRSFSIELKKEEVLRKRVSVFDNVTEDKMGVATKVTKGDFKKLKYRPHTKLRMRARIILR